MSQPAFKELAPPQDSDILFDDGEPLESAWHALQLPFLSESFRRAMAEQGRSDFWVGHNNFVYYSYQQVEDVRAEVLGESDEKRAFRGPDVFWVGGVDPARLRNGWVAWHEDGKLPDVIVEVLSPSTARKDRTEKKRLYEQVFATAEYFLCDPDRRLLEGYRLNRGKYQAIPPDGDGHLWSEQLAAAFGRWHGEVQGLTDDWFRLFHADGSPLLTRGEMADVAERRAEAAVERAEAESRRAEAENRRAEAENRRAEEESRRAEAANRRAEAERLRAEGAEAELARLRRELETLR